MAASQPFHGPIVGLDLQAPCTPGVLWRDTTGPTGVLTLTCGAQFRNRTHDTLYVWAIARYPDGRGDRIRNTWTLEPGHVTLTLPPPPAGAYWTLYTQTAYQRNYGDAAKWAGIGVGVGLAVVGAWTVGEAIARRRW